MVTPTVSMQAVMAAEAPVPTLGRILTYLVAARLSATQIVIAYADSETGSVLVADVAGDTVTPNSPTTFARSKPLSLSLSGLGPSSFILSFYTKYVKLPIVSAVLPRRIIRQSKLLRHI